VHVFPVRLCSFYIGLFVLDRLKNWCPHGGKGLVDTRLLVVRVADVSMAHTPRTYEQRFISVVA